MNFTVKFINGSDTESLTFDLVFTPSPVWMQSQREIIQLNPESPKYQAGSLRILMHQVPVLAHLQNKECTVFVHESGNGSKEDLKTLVTDLKSHGFMVQVIR